LAGVCLPFELKSCPWNGRTSLIPAAQMSCSQHRQCRLTLLRSHWSRRLDRSVTALAKKPAIPAPSLPHRILNRAVTQKAASRLRAFAYRRPATADFYPGLAVSLLPAACAVSKGPLTASAATPGRCSTSCTPKPAAAYLRSSGRLLCRCVSTMKSQSVRAAQLHPAGQG
jgi:hypothetical protein